MPIRCCASLLFAALLLCSCAATGGSGSGVLSAITRVDVGMTTNQVVGLLGRPATIVPDMIGETWTWKHVTRDHLGVPGSKAVAVQIRNGRVFAVRKP